MRSISRPPAVLAFRLAAFALLAVSWSACSFFNSDTPSSPKKKGWVTLPWGGTSRVTDATPYIEYQRTQTHDSEPISTLLARNTHPTKTIEGQMRTPMTTGPGDMKVDSQSFTLGPNEQKRLLIYPSRFPLTYEVTASFRE